MKKMNIPSKIFPVPFAGQRNSASFKWNFALSLMRYPMLELFFAFLLDTWSQIGKKLNNNDNNNHNNSLLCVCGESVNS